MAHNGYKVSSLDGQIDIFQRMHLHCARIIDFIQIRNADQLTENNENLIAGVNAKAEIIIDEVEGALAVPIEAVQDCICSCCKFSTTNIGFLSSVSSAKRPTLMLTRVTVPSMGLIIFPSEKGEKVSGVVERISPTGELKEGSAAERVIPTVIRLTENNENPDKLSCFRARVFLAASTFSSS